MMTLAYLKSLTFAGLFSYTTESTVRLSDLVVIVGPNNTGKSNLFRIIRILTDALHHNKALSASEMSQSTDNPYIKAEITLSQDERCMLADFLACERINNSEDRIKMVHMPDRERTVNSLDGLIIKIKWKKMPDGSSRQPNAEIQFPRYGFACKGRVGANDLNVVPLGERPYTQHSPKPMQFNRFMMHISRDGYSKADSAAFFSSYSVVHQSIRFSLSNIDGLDVESQVKIRKIMHRLDINGEVIVNLPYILGAILTRNTVYATENRNLLQDKVTKTFERLALPARQIDSFENKYNTTLANQLVNESMEHAGTLEHDGGNIAQFLFNLKNSPEYSDAESYRTIKKRFEQLFRTQKLTVEPIWEHHVIRDPLMGKVNIPRPHIAIADQRLSKYLPLEQVGAGTRGVIYLLAAVHGAKNAIVMLDEPGTNMHPAMLQAVMEGIDVQDSGNQILVVTHSPDLLRYEMNHENASVICVRNTGGQSRICQIDDATSQDKDDLRGIRRRIDPGVFFAKRVVLVEGLSEIVLLNGLADGMAVKDPKYNLPLNNVVIVSVEGKCNFPTYRKLLDRYDIPWIILSDEDSLARTFKDEEVSWVSKDGVEGGGPIYIIKGDLEKLMRRLNPDIFDKVENRSKVIIADEFVREMREKKSEQIPCVIVEFLDRCVE